MNFYSLTSKAYDILDVVYFANKEKNPRITINDLIRNGNVRILDMCCGTLSNSIPIAKKHQNAKITGVDISKRMLRVAQKKITHNHLNNICLINSDATNTTLTDNMFDYVVIGLVLHEINPSLRKNMLKEAYRVLKPNGCLIVLEWEKPTSVLQKLLFFPLLIVEQALCKSFWEFYNCDKKQFFLENNFEVCKELYCNYSTVFKLRKVTN